MRSMFAAESRHRIHPALGRADLLAPAPRSALNIRRTFMPTSLVFLRNLAEAVAEYRKSIIVQSILGRFADI